MSAPRPESPLLEAHSTLVSYAYWMNKTYIRDPFAYTTGLCSGDNRQKMIEFLCAITELSKELKAYRDYVLELEDENKFLTDEDNEMFSHYNTMKSRKLPSLYGKFIPTFEYGSAPQAAQKSPPPYSDYPEPNFEDLEDSHYDNWLLDINKRSHMKCSTLIASEETAVSPHSNEDEDENGVDEDWLLITQQSACDSENDS